MADSTPIAVVAIGGNSLIKDNKHPEVRHQWDAGGETTSTLPPSSRTAGTWWSPMEMGPRSASSAAQRTGGARSPRHAAQPDRGRHPRRNRLHVAAGAEQRVHLARHPSQRYCACHASVGGRGGSGVRQPDQAHRRLSGETTARRFETEGWRVVEDVGAAGVAIASPEPQEIVESAAIIQALRLGWTVVAVGGGGVPVVRNEAGELRGVSAVIDKDRASSLLATTIDADLFLISTGVEKVADQLRQAGSGGPYRFDRERGGRYLAAGHFAPGSMKPKIEAALRFLRSSLVPQAATIITNPDNLMRAVRGESGTRIVRDPQ
ncbi:MAG: carbamate kinase [Caldilineaceae bacterium]